MNKPGVFRVVRSFRANGETFQKGRVIRLDDATQIAQLVSSGAIEAEDKATRARLKIRSVFQWRETDQPHAPALNMKVNY